jgi:hypothetical protein
MRISLRHLALAVPFTLFAVACGDDDDATGPTSNTASADGIVYSARVDLIQNVLYPTKPPAFFQITATLTNRRAVMLTRTFPAGCPVRIRLERDADNAVVYDETRRPCADAPSTVVNVEPNLQRTISSGMKVFDSFRGDSIPEGTYTVFATLQPAGASPIVLRAGTVTF